MDTKQIIGAWNENSVMTNPGRKKEVSDEEIVRAIALHPDPIVTAAEVAENIDMTKQGTNNRLNDLAEDGYVVKKKVGGRAVVYWLTNEGKELASQS